MKALIAVVSAHSRPQWNKAIRSTWLKLVPGEFDVRFFYGRGEHLGAQADEVTLDCDDSYQGLPEKVQKIVRWADERSYDRVLKCDDDVVLDPNLLLKSEWNRGDFVGGHSGDALGKGRVNGNVNIMVPTGFCYWMSQKAMKHVIQAALPSNNIDERWVALTLFQKNIRLSADHRYYAWTGADTHRQTTKGRPLRRPVVPKQEQVDGTFAWCICLGWGGWHRTPIEEEIKEFRSVFDRFVNKNQ
jgi:hypothetical protein